MKNEKLAKEHLNNEIHTLQLRVNELEKSEKQYISIFNLTPDGIITLDLKGTFIDGNLMAEKLWSLESRETFQSAKRWRKKLRTIPIIWNV